MRVRKVTATFKVLSYLVKGGVKQAAWLLETFEGNFGHLLSRQMRLPLTKEGEPLPWYTYPAIEYLQQLDFSSRDVFEFGSGNSSQFWAQKARSVTSVESDRKWHALVEQRKRQNQVLLLEEEPRDYPLAIGRCHGSFDVIAIDGVERFECAKNALPCLRAGGMIILDNSDWHPKTAALLRKADLIQIDFIGFGPVNNYTWATSLFLHREVRIVPRSARLPEPGIGSLIQDRDADDASQAAQAIAVALRDR
jgi:hypothetical protein